MGLENVLALILGMTSRNGHQKFASSASKQTLIYIPFSPARAKKILSSCTRKTKVSISVGNKYSKISMHKHFNNTKHQMNDNSLMKGNFVVCKYDLCCWVGIILEVGRINQDVLGKCMHPPLPSETFT